MVGLLFSYGYQIADIFAFLVLASAGLAIVFGMMGVINMAHGEFIMCGAYVTVAVVKLGIPLPIAILCGAIVSGLAGALVEAVIVRRFYSRPIDTLLATWGLSIIVTQAVLLLFGPSLSGIGTPPGSFVVGDYTFSTYRVILFASSILVLLLIYFVFMKTRFGILARATMQNAAMAQALGVRVSWVYAASFGFGAALAGLCGGLYAPTLSIVPMMGSTFVVDSFVTVVIGGANVLLGTAPAAALLAIVRTGLNNWHGQVVGQIGMLLAVMVVIRVLPDGVTGLIERRSR